VEGLPFIPASVRCFFAPVGLESVPPGLDAFLYAEKYESMEDIRNAQDQDQSRRRQAIQNNRHGQDCQGQGFQEPHSD